MHEKTAGRVLLLLAHALLALAFSGLAGCSPAPEGLDHSHTDVLWITICTLRADHLGAYGYAKDVSPTLDGLAARGVLFERTLTPAPWTRPAIASTITALYPRSLGFMEPGEVKNRALPASLDTVAEHFQRAGYYTIGITANPNTNPTFHFDQGYDFYRGTNQRWQQGYEDKKLTADDVVSLLLEQLRGPARGRRFFAHLVLVDTHLPYLSEVAWARTDRFEPSGPHPDYDRQIRYVDTVVAELLAELEELGRRDTLLVLTSDHGEGFQESRPEDYLHGSHLYNSALWVPFILYHPALEARARRVRETVELVDVMPTLLDLLDLPFDATEVEGRSLASLITDTGEVPEFREFGVSETRVWRAHQSAIVKGGWKLIVDHAQEPASVELYNFREDPLERRNLAPGKPAKVRRLRELLAAWQEARRPREPLTDANPTERDLEALRALGYIGEGTTGSDDAGPAPPGP